MTPLLVQAIGHTTGKIYVEGTKADCLKKLQQKYPSCGSYSTSNGRDGMTLPEPMKFIRVGGEEPCQRFYNALWTV
ncbi:hypothetical protein [Metasolibacillus sp.]|uniref:hypothetical protein n=1 Tax=Metasolibacillus sp. TaxID=2703680 RepID=UPI0025F5050B|nr:hypothetical protein [Metasolibacillus sp.]MCT6922779.1 hypothetical protein [Metasolibacillus sp.]MCT6938882.1 hypothetical protein [Metasolibacillus sp.]